MRKTRNIQNKYRGELLQDFSWYFNESRFDEIFVSVFDHWLNHEEADKELCDLPPATLLVRREAYNIFHEKLLESSQAFAFVKRGKGRKHYVQIKEFIGQKEGLEYMSYEDYRLPTRCYRKILIPDCKCVYLQGPDYTSQLLYLNERDIRPLLDMAGNSGLHILK